VVLYCTYCMSTPTVFALEQQRGVNSFLPAANAWTDKMPNRVLYVLLYMFLRYNVLNDVVCRFDLLRVEYDGTRYCTSTSTTVQYTTVQVASNRTYLSLFKYYSE
jgi:hypothetical protein